MDICSSIKLCNDIWQLSVSQFAETSYGDDIWWHTLQSDILQSRSYYFMYFVIKS